MAKELLRKINGATLKDYHDGVMGLLNNAQMDAHSVKRVDDEGGHRRVIILAPESTGSEAAGLWHTAILMKFFPGRRGLFALVNVTTKDITDIKNGNPVGRLPRRNCLIAEKGAFIERVKVSLQLNYNLKLPESPKFHVYSMDKPRRAELQIVGDPVLICGNKIVGLYFEPVTKQPRRPTEHSARGDVDFSNTVHGNLGFIRISNRDNLLLP